MQMSCSDAAPVRIPTYEAGFHDAPKGNTPMGTPPSAKGIAAELPFAAGNFCNNSQKNSDIGTCLQIINVGLQGLQSPLRLLLENGLEAIGWVHRQMMPVEQLQHLLAA